MRFRRRFVPQMDGLAIRVTPSDVAGTADVAGTTDPSAATSTATAPILVNCGLDDLVYSADDGGDPMEPWMPTGDQFTVATPVYPASVPVL